MSLDRAREGSSCCDTGLYEGHTKEVEYSVCLQYGFVVIKSAKSDHGMSAFEGRRANVSPSLSDRAYHHLDISDMDNHHLNRHTFRQ